jgi:hypothetical protein
VAVDPTHRRLTQICVPPLLVYPAIMAPHFAAFWSAMSRPNLTVVQSLLGGSVGAAATWAHLVGFDVFLGRWIYLDSRQRRIHPLIASPILLITIVLSPIGVLTYLLIRSTRLATSADHPCINAAGNIPQSTTPGRIGAKLSSLSLNLRRESKTDPVAPR